MQGSPREERTSGSESSSLLSTLTRTLTAATTVGRREWTTREVTRIRHLERLPNLPLTPPAAAAAVAAPPVVPKHHGHPGLKALGAGALAGGIATALKVSAVAAGGIGLGAAGLMYLIAHHPKK